MGKRKSCKGTETITSSLPVSTAMTLISRIRHIHSRDGKFWVFNYFKIHLNFDEA